MSALLSRVRELLVVRSELEMLLIRVCELVSDRPVCGFPSAVEVQFEEHPSLVAIEGWGSVPPTNIFLSISLLPGGRTGRSPYFRYII